MNYEAHKAYYALKEQFDHWNFKYNNSLKLDEEYKKNINTNYISYDDDEEEEKPEEKKSPKTEQLLTFVSTLS